MTELGKVGKAIILTGHGVVKGLVKLCLTNISSAVPAALSGSSCAGFSRLWILKPVDGIHNVWKIVEKLPFFILQSILESGTNIVRLRDQMIFG